MAGGGFFDRLKKNVSPAAVLAGVLKANTPTLDDEVTVEVTGAPGATKQTLYYLALATANGMVRRFSSLGIIAAFVSPTYGLIMIEYDAASNWVRLTIRYQSGMYINRLAAPILPAFSTATWGSLFDQLAVYRGPQCGVVGGAFNFVSSSVGTPGIPANANSPGAPGGAAGLPFAGQPILTACPTTPTPNPVGISQQPVQSFPLSTTSAPGPSIPSPNFQPPGDNRSRGVVNVPSTTLRSGSSSAATCCVMEKDLVALVFAALSGAASNADMTFPPPVQGLPAPMNTPG